MSWMQDKLYLYIDESGDTGIKFEKGSSVLFVLSIVIILEKNDTKLNTIFKKLNLDSREIKFSKTSFKNKMLFFEGLKNLDFESEVFVFKKKRKINYMDYISVALNYTALHTKTKEVLITIDGLSENVIKNSDIKNIKLITKVKTKIIFIDSTKSIFLQLSDMLAGLVHSIYKDKNDYNFLLQRLKHKVKITHIE